MAKKSDYLGAKFGAVAGVSVGQLFPSRDAVRRAGLHRHNQAGISGVDEVGADAIVVSGGYDDDEDFGDRIIYTGEGGQKNGKQVRDQKLTNGNAALVLSHEIQNPVRVIRGYEADGTHLPEHLKPPKKGYRYDGLYRVVDSWYATGGDGHLIWRFTLVKIPDDGPEWVAPVVPAVVDVMPIVLPPGSEAPGRSTRTSSVTKRERQLASLIKQLHDHRCQVCGEQVSTLEGHKVQAAHIQPIGTPHRGPDKAENMLCLCPNHHALLDGFAIEISDDYVVSHTESGVELGPLRRLDGHEINTKHLKEHRRLVEAKRAAIKRAAGQ